VVTGAVEYGEITAVSVETMDAETGETADIVQVYSGEVTRSVPVETTLATAQGRTRVVIRATDSEGTGHTESFFVDPASGTVFAGERTPTPTPTPETPTPTPTITATTLTANASANTTTTVAPTATEPANGTPATTSTPKPGVTELLTSMPGFGIGPAVLALLLILVLASRRS
ncbi:MAG: PGF-CTERM sorting domain-containing protein, partial [Halobacteriales archaeon]|nr:PGF-CTERM sorting domain-containing protein [Halobacteriales archaeon]